MTPEEMAVKLTETEQRSKSNSHRLDSVEKRQDKLDEMIQTINGLSIKQDATDADVKEIKADVKALTMKPAKRWDGMVDKLIYAVIGAFIAWALSGAPGA